ncbi:MAG: diguanylate cyclase [Gorillibacterium sp.]|nr:diguanylate cyclase [Gorillibacterium sp.]
MEDERSATLPSQKDDIVDPNVWLTTGLQMPGFAVSGVNAASFKESVWIEGFRSWVVHSITEGMSFKGWLLLTDGSGKLLSLCVIDGHPAFYAPSECWMLDRAGEALALASSTAVSGKPLRSSGLATMSVIDENGRTLCVIGTVSQSDTKGDMLYQLAGFFIPCLLLEAEKVHYQQQAGKQRREKAEFLKKEAIFLSIQKLFSLIDVQMILSEVIYQVHDFFPDAKVDLLLSQDGPGGELPIKSMNIFDANSELCMRAFMEGKPATVPSASASLTEIAAPLAGKQGVYGVFHLRMGEFHFSQSDLRHISMITSAAGIAFENGKLYEQSNLLINELRLINELTKRLNQSLKLNEIFQYAVTELLQIFGADYCCILLSDPEGEKLLVQVCNIPDIDHEVFEVDEDFPGIVYRTKEPVIVSDYDKEQLVKSKLMEFTGCRSLIASPIFVNGDVVGVILITHRVPNYFTYENYKLLYVLSAPIGLAISNASLHAEVRRMVITDNLTGLYTRRYLDDQVNLHQKVDLCGSLIVVDIDDFKRVNDTLGHLAGDQVIIQVSEISRTCIRETDIAARWGGEELAVYLPHVGAEQANIVAERIRLRVFEETNPNVTVSCGVSDWHASDEKVSVEHLFYRSDMALYMAKRAGKNRIKLG